MRRGGRRLRAAGLGLCVVLLAQAAPAADTHARLDDRWHRQSIRDRLFFFSGADIASDSAFGWAGTIGAWNGSLDEDGWRLRVMGGAGRYRYRTGAVAAGVNDADVRSGELMLGYRTTFGDLNATVWFGGHVENHSLHLPDPGHSTQGIEAGVKAAIELYHRFASDSFLTASASASTVHDSYQLRLTMGREVSTLAFGLEAALLGDARYREPRAGIFVQSTLGRSTIALSAGYLSNSDKGGGAYATLSVHAAR
jgi:hypothetical protein